MKKKFFGSLFLFLSTISFSQTYSGGSGTIGDPFQISNKNDLKYLSENTNQLGYHFVQTADIVFTSSDYDVSGDFYNNGRGFNPIGLNDPFTGSYNGQFYTIDSLKFDYPNGYFEGAGLFGWCQNATLSNIKLTNITITNPNDNYDGGIAGSIENTQILRCSVLGGVLFSNGSVGGIAGGVGGTSTVNECVTDVDISASSTNTELGGIIGWLYGGDLLNSYSEGDIQGTTNNKGGLTGSLSSPATIAKCYSIMTGVESEGLVGTFLGGSLSSSCFWNSDLWTSSQGTSKTTTEMKTKSTFTAFAWDFIEETTNGTNGTWMMGYGSADGVAYPKLRWTVFSSDNEGTVSDPFEISNLNELRALSENSGLWNKYYVQTADIDASPSTSWNLGDHDGNGGTPDEPMGFMPIGNSTTAFTGTYNGDFHAISNIYSNRPNQECVGFFGKTSGATISNVSLVDADIYGMQYVGGFVGRLSSSSILNSISVSGQARSLYSTLGGFAGVHEGSAAITNCYAHVNVDGDNEVGGFIGVTVGSPITNCYAKGTITTLGSIGGFCATKYGGTYTSCFYDSEVSGQSDNDGRGVPKTTAEMKTQSTFTGAGWDFATTPIWKMDTDCQTAGYPIFDWQNFSNPVPTVSSTTPDFTCGTGDVTLSASASAGTIKWYTASTGGSALTTGGSYTLSGNDLTISNVSSSTTYYAEADNSGCVSSSREAVEASVSDNATPTGLTTSAISLASAELSWTHAGAENMQIQYRKAGNSSWKEITVAYADNYTLVHFLGQFAAATDYEWRVRVSCGGSYGAYSSIQTFATPCKAATNLQASSISLSNVTLNWDHQGGENMLIQYRKLGNTMWQSTSEIAYSKPYVLTPTIGNFLEATDYEWRVRVKCGTEWGDYSTIYVFSTPCKAASNLVASNISLSNVSFSWTHPGGDNMLIEYRKVGNSKWQTTNEITYAKPYVLTPALGNFVEATDYEWRVRVKCGADWGSYSAISTFSSPCKTPVSLNASNISTSDVTITFTHPGGDNMLIEYRKTGNTKWQTTGEITYSNNYQLIPDLGQFALNTTYEYRVRIQCGVTWGDYSAIETFTTPVSSMKVQNSNYEYNGIKAKTSATIETYPNPNDGNFTIQSSEECTLKIVNELGQLIQTVELTKENGYQLNAEGLRSGFYFLTGTINNEIITKKVLVQ